MFDSSEQTSTWDRLDMRKFAFYGASATLFVDALIYPFNVLATRIQVDTKSKVTLIQSMYKVLVSTLKQDGVRGLYRGFSISTFGGLPSQGFYFLGYQSAESYLQKWNVVRVDRPELRSPAKEIHKLPPWTVPYMAGFLADVIAAPFWIPIEVISSRMQIQGDGVIQYKSSWHAVKHIYATEGIQGFFHGLQAQIIAFGPASALWFGLYDTVKRWSVGTFGDLGPGKEMQWYLPILPGLVAGTGAAILTNPLDIAKTRLQTQHLLLKEFVADHSLQSAAADKRASQAAATAEKNERLLRKLAFFKRLPRGNFAHGGSSSSYSVTLRRRSAQLIAEASLGAAAEEAATELLGRVTSSHGSPHPKRPHPAPLIAFPSKMRRIPLLPPLPLPSPHGFLTSVASAARAAGTPSLADRGPLFASVGSLPFHSSLASAPEAIRRNAAAVQEALENATIEVVGRRRRAGELVHVKLPSSVSPSAFYPSSARSVKIHSNMTSVLRDMITNEGPASLMRGVLPRIITSGPASALTFLAYEQVVKASLKSATDEE